MHTALVNAWVGVWQGVGFAVFSLMLWIGWHLLHRKVAHKFDSEHFFHTIHEFFSK